MVSRFIASDGRQVRIDKSDEHGDVCKIVAARGIVFAASGTVRTTDSQNGVERSLLEDVKAAVEAVTSKEDLGVVVRETVELFLASTTEANVRGVSTESLHVQYVLLTTSDGRPTWRVVTVQPPKPIIDHLGDSDQFAVSVVGHSEAAKARHPPPLFTRKLSTVANIEKLLDEQHVLTPTVVARPYTIGRFTNRGFYWIKRGKC